MNQQPANKKKLDGFTITIAVIVTAVALALPLSSNRTVSQAPAAISAPEVPIAAESSILDTTTSATESIASLHTHVDAVALRLRLMEGQLSDMQRLLQEMLIEMRHNDEEE